jgi:serine/threonine protein kinase
MHSRGLFHRDLKASNVLISRGDPVVCDLDGAGVKSAIPRARAAKDLARLVKTLYRDCTSSRDDVRILLSGYLLRMNRSDSGLSDLERHIGADGNSIEAENS